MHKQSAYERYLQSEIKRYGWFESEDNEIPSWLVHEFKVYYWMFRLSRKMYDPINDYSVSNQLMFRLKNIRNTSYAKYKNISPELQTAVNKLCNELGNLYDDLISDSSLWKKEKILSTAGIKRWEKSLDVISDCSNVEPNPEWREEVEKAISSPYCTRREAERIAIEFVKKTEGIDLLAIDPEDGKAAFYYHNVAKNNIFKMSYGCFLKDAGCPMESLGVIKVDMLSRRASKEG